jgi:transcriptional regulator with XRE-family HTH domain
MNILDQLIQIRKEQRYHQKDVAKKLGVTYAMMSHYETKKRKMSHELIVKFADFLGYELRILKK